MAMKFGWISGVGQQTIAEMFPPDSKHYFIAMSLFSPDLSALADSYVGEVVRGSVYPAAKAKTIACSLTFDARQPSARQRERGATKIFSTTAFGEIG